MARFGHDMCVDCSISYLLAQIMTLRLLKRGTSMAPLANSSEPWTPALHCDLWLRVSLALAMVLVNCHGNLNLKSTSSNRKYESTNGGVSIGIDGCTPKCISFQRISVVDHFIVPFSSHGSVTFIKKSVYIMELWSWNDILWFNKHLRWGTTSPQRFPSEALPSTQDFHWNHFKLHDANKVKV